MRKLLLCVTMIFAILMTGCNNEAITIQDTQDSKKSLEFIILEDEAVSAATKFLNKGEYLESRSTSNAKVETIWRNIKLDGKQSRNASESDVTEVPIYVVSYTDENKEPNGYVVTVGDKRVIDRVLVFSDEGYWNLSGIPAFENMFWNNVDNFLTQTLSESDMDMCDTYEYEEQGSIEKFAVDRFLIWGPNESPYNDSIPWCSSINSNMPASAVEVALGQILAHHEHPKSGTYIHPRYNRTVNTIYNWSSMKASSDARLLPSTIGRSGIANLLAEIGYRLNTEYGCDYSNPEMYKIYNMLRDLGYFSSNLTNFDFNKIVEDIDAKRPVFMQYTQYGWHEWVIEGYRQIVNNVIYGRDCPDESLSIPPTIIDYSVISNYLYFNLGLFGVSNGFYSLQTIESLPYPHAGSFRIIHNIQIKQ